MGGSGRSQRELAARLGDLGHEVLFLADDGTPDRVRRFMYEQLADLAARWGQRPGALVIRFVEGRPGRRTVAKQIDSAWHRVTPVPENGAASVLESFRPDVVVGNSILRLTWRKVRALCQQQGIATVLYVREVASMNHFTLGVLPADRIVANASSLALQVEQLGYSCQMLPSVIEVNVTAVKSSRQVALVVNPIASHGIDLIWQLARRLPEVPFVLQQSWPLSVDAVASIERAAGDLPNVEFRRVMPAGVSLYHDARILLVPHRLDNRPRVITEAQANGIPVIASFTPGLAEAVGEGGILLDMDDLDGWVAAIRDMWPDAPPYDEFAKSARAYGRRPEIDPARLAQRFDLLLKETYRENSGEQVPMDEEWGEK